MEREIAENQAKKMNEMDIKKLSKTALRKYSKRFPKYTQRYLEKIKIGLH